MLERWNTMWKNSEGETFINQLSKEYKSNKKANVKKLIMDKLDENFKDIEKAYLKITEYSDRGEYLPKASE